MDRKRRPSYRDFERNIGNFLKREIDELGLTYRQFSYKMADKELKGKGHALLQRLRRGQFSAAFFLAALKALDISNVNVAMILGAKPLDKRIRTKRVRVPEKNIKKSKGRPKFTTYSEEDSWTRKVGLRY